MKLYLIRHGEAATGGGGGERSLTEKGRHETGKVADFLGRMGLEVRSIQHSGKLRAQQTAEILGSRIVSKEGVAPAPGLCPNDDTQPWSRELADSEEDLALVGHLPFVSRLASRLLTGEENREVVEFRTSSVLCLRRNDDGAWRISYFVTPDEV